MKRLVRVHSRIEFGVQLFAAGTARLLAPCHLRGQCMFSTTIEVWPPAELCDIRFNSQ